MDLRLQRMINEIDNKVRKAHKRGKCFVLGCGKDSIRSHIIAEQTLKIIADQQKKVLTWLPQSKKSGRNIIKSIESGQTGDQLYGNLEYVNISGNDLKVTEPLFCHDHDSSIFMPIEREEISLEPDPEQVFLFAYRALCSALFSTKIVNIATDPYSTIMGDAYQRKQRFQAQDVVNQNFQLYEQMRLTHQYDQLECLIYPVDMPLCLATTYSFVPLLDREAIAEGKQILPIEDAINFSFLPHISLNKSICIISFLRTSQRAPWYLALNNINTCSQIEQRDFFISLAFGSPTTLYLSPEWWQSLSNEKRDIYNKLARMSHEQDLNLFLF